MNPLDLIHQYLAVWNERDAARRADLMRAVLTEDSIYSDPDYEGLKGHAALSEAIDRAQGKFGDLVFDLGPVVGVHHDKALFRWLLKPPGGGDPVAAGYDYVEFGGSRISRIVGFFE